MLVDSKFELNIPSSVSKFCCKSTKRDDVLLNCKTIEDKSMKFVVKNITTGYSGNTETTMKITSCSLNVVICYPKYRIYK